jgi:hypothetical protein
MTDASVRYGHLPPGHPPGKQSKRVARGRPWGPALLFLFGLGALGAGIALWAGRNSAKSKSGSEVGAIVFLAVALLLILGALWLWRRLFGPHVARYLGVSVEPGLYQRGDPVRATLTVSDPSRIEGKLQVGLVCTAFHDVEVQTTNANGTTSTQRQTRQTEVVKDWRDADPTKPQQMFDFTLPADSPFSYEGETVSWAWRISAREQREHRSDPHNDVPIWVLP